MTREEAIKWLEEAINDTNNDFDLYSDALKKELAEAGVKLWNFLN